MGGKKDKKNSGLKFTGSVLLMLIWVAASVIVGQLVVGYIMIAMLGRDTFAQPMWTAVYSALAYILALLLIIFVPVLIFERRRKKHPKEMDGELAISRTTLGLKGLPTWSDIGLAPVGFAVYLLLAVLVSSLFSLFPWFDATETQDVGFGLYVVGFDRIIAFITLVVLAPIAEEVIFRGWLYGKMREKLNLKVSNMVSMIISILLVSILFGALHMQWNVGVNVFAMSIVLCGLREVTGTIYAGILMHMLKNGVAFYMLYVLGMR